MNYDEEVEKFLALFGINNSTSAMRSQKIKIHELLKLIIQCQIKQNLLIKHV